MDTEWLSSRSALQVTSWIFWAGREISEPQVVHIYKPINLLVHFSHITVHQSCDSAALINAVI